MSAIGSWGTFFGLSSFQMLVMFRRGLFYTFLSLYLREYLGLSVTETTLLATLPMGASSLCQMFVWGSLSDRLQLRRTLIVLGEAIAAIGTLGLWYAHLLPEGRHLAGYVVILGLSLIEVFWSMSNVGWSALISDIYPGARRSAVQGQLVSLGGLGGILGVYIGSLLYDGLGQAYRGWGFREGSLFFVAAGAMLVSTLAMFFVPEGGHRDAVQGREGDAGRSPYPARLFALFLVSIALVNFGRNAMSVLRAPFLSLSSGLDLAPREIQWVVNVRSAAMILTGGLVGRVCRRLGDGTALLAGAGLAAASLVVFGFAGGLPTASAGNLLAGVSESVIVASSYTLASLLIPGARRARLFGWFNATFFLSWGVGGTFLVAPLIDLLLRLGVREVPAYRAGFVTATAMTGTGLLLLFRVLGRMKAAERTAIRP